VVFSVSAGLSVLTGLASLLRRLRKAAAASGKPGQSGLSAGQPRDRREADVARSSPPRARPARAFTVAAGLAAAPEGSAAC